MAIALPLGLVTGHTGRGGAFLSLVSNATRALPTSVWWYSSAS